MHVDTKGLRVTFLTPQQPAKFTIYVNVLNQPKFVCLFLILARIEVQLPQFTVFAIFLKINWKKASFDWQQKPVRFIHTSRTASEN